MFECILTLKIIAKPCWFKPSSGIFYFKFNIFKRIHAYFTNKIVINLICFFKFQNKYVFKYKNIVLFISTNILLTMIASKIISVIFSLKRGYSQLKEFNYFFSKPKRLLIIH